MKIVFFSIFILSMLIASVLCNEDAVLVLDAKNFTDTIAANKYILVEFYAPWCHHCKALTPIYAAAADKLKSNGSSAKLAKIDATVETELATEYQVKSYPTLFMFIAGESIPYLGERREEDILQFVVNVLQAPSPIILEDIHQLKEFQNKHNITAIGFFRDVNSIEAITFNKVSTVIFDVKFGLISDPDAFLYYNIQFEKQIVLFKHFDEVKSNYEGDYKMSSIHEFINKYKLPLIQEFTSTNYRNREQNEIKLYLTLVVSKADDYSPTVEKLFARVARKFKNKVNFVIIDTNEEYSKNAILFLGLREIDFPCFRLVDITGDMVKYKPDENDLTEENIVTFLNEYFEDGMKPALNSEDLPENWNAHPVKMLVAHNLFRFAQDPAKAVIVYFYTLTCETSKGFLTSWEKLGEAYADHPFVVVAQFNTILNDIENFKVGRYSIKFSPKGSDKFIDYEGEHKLDPIKKFIEQNGVNDNEKVKNVNNQQETNDVDSEENDVREANNAKKSNEEHEEL